MKEQNYKKIWTSVPPIARTTKGTKQAKSHSIQNPSPIKVNYTKRNISKVLRQRHQQKQAINLIVLEQNSVPLPHPKKFFYSSPDTQPKQNLVLHRAKLTTLLLAPIPNIPKNLSVNREQQSLGTRKTHFRPKASSLQDTETKLSNQFLFYKEKRQTTQKDLFTSFVITGPRSALGSVPTFTLRALTCSKISLSL